MNKRIHIALCMISLFAFALPTVVIGEEVIVTGSYRVQKDIPGAFLKRRGDFLLLAVTVSNDTREEAARKNEIYETLKNALSVAAKQSVELTIIDNQDNVVALTRDNYQIDLRKGPRPDMSSTTIRVKKRIPDNVTDADRLITEMVKFSGQISVVGRTVLEPAGSVEVSLIDPNQYRSQILQRFTQDVAQVMTSLGADYRLLIKDIDRPVRYSRAGQLDVALYIPYSYRIVPTSVNSLGND